MTKEQKVRLAVFTLVSVAALIAILGYFVIESLREAGAPYYIDFREASVNGLISGAPVKYQGVEIGRVERIRVNRTDLSSVLVWIQVRDEFPVKADMTATLAYQGITGQKFVQITGGTTAARDLEPGSRIETAPGLEERAEDIVVNIDSAVESIARLLSPENLERISTALENVTQTTETLTSVVGGRRESLTRAIDNIEQASADFARIAKGLETLTANFNAMTAEIREDTDQVLGNAAARLSEEEMGQAITEFRNFIQASNRSVRRIETALLDQQNVLNRTFQGLADTLDSLSRFARELSEDPAVFLRGRREKK